MLLVYFLIGCLPEAKLVGVVRGTPDEDVVDTDDGNGASGDTGGEDTGGEDTGVEDTGGEDTGGEDTGSADTGSDDTGGEDTGGEDTGSDDTGDACSGIDTVSPDTIRISSVATSIWSIELSGCATGIVAHDAVLVHGSNVYEAAWSGVPTEVDGTGYATLEYSGGDVALSDVLTLTIDTNQGSGPEVSITMY